MIDGRLIQFASHEGARNMAIDQAILESASELPTLRFYGWSVATLSLGYFQRIAERERHSKSQSLVLVRRSTGGGAIVHDRELTYSLVLPLASQKRLFNLSSSLGAVPQLYETIHLAVIDALRDFGCRAELHGKQNDPEARAPMSVRSRAEPRNEHDAPYLCFQRRSEWDVTMSGYKVLGSAQRRVRGATLQHGSVLIAASPHAPELPGVQNLGAIQVNPEQLAENIMRTLQLRLGVRWIPGSLNLSEQKLSDWTKCDRFESSAWTRRR